MMQFVRPGPELIIIEPKNLLILEQYLINEHKAVEYKEQNLNEPVDFHMLFDQLRDHDSILFISNQIDQAVKDHKFERIFITHSNISQLMIGMLNHDEKLIQRIQRSARVLFLKTVGDVDRVINRIADDFNGEIINSKELYELHSAGAIIQLTLENLDKTLRCSENHPKAVYVKGDERETYLELAKRAIRYVNVGLYNQSWYELNIKIYDSYGHYECHYNRLMYVLDKLDIGVMAGETWGTDAALVFLSVDTYNVRMVTYLEPKEFKSILLGLEYAGDGERKVDFDLYYRRRKVSWTDIRGKQKVSRDELGMLCRKKIYDQLDTADKEHLRGLEMLIKTSVK